VTNNDERAEEEIQLQESWLRYMAALPARDEAEQDLYGEWTDRDQARPQQFYGMLADELQCKTPGEFRRLAESALPVEVETGPEVRHSFTEVPQPSLGEAELEAGS